MQRKMPCMQRDCSILVNMLNSNHVESLRDDGFAGSIDEHRIFSEVFSKDDSGETSKRCLVTRPIHFKCDCVTHTDAHFCSNCETSAITSQVDFFDMRKNFRENFIPVLSSEGLALSERSKHDACAKRIKLSVDELSDVHLNSEKVLNTWGVTSSCYQLKQQVETEKDRGDGDAYKCKSSDLVGSERIEVFDLDGSDLKAAVASKAIASPVSQESSVTQVLALNPSLTVTYKDKHLLHSKKWKESSFLKIGIDELPSAKNVLKDPCSFVRYHVNCFLIAAGWDVGRRKRSEKFKGVGELIWRSPFGRPIREFYRAWDLCGLSLFDDANYGVWEVDGKQWTDSTQFLSDLSNAVVEIEKLLDRPQTTATLCHGWCLLDPFATVLLVDKQVSLLRAGKGIKASRGLVIDPSAKFGVDLTMKNENQADRHMTDAPGSNSMISVSALTIHEEEYFTDKPCRDGGSGHRRGHRRVLLGQGKQLSTPSEGTCIPSVDIVRGLSARYKRISGKKRSSSDLICLPPCGSNNGCNQSASCLFEVPVGCKNANIMCGESQTVSPCQDTCASRYDKERSVCDGELLLEVINGPSTCGSVEEGLCLDEWKALKKSKKISEIKLTKFYHNRGILPSSCMPQLPDADAIYVQSKLRCHKNCRKSSACFYCQNDHNLTRSKKLCSKSRSCAKLAQFNFGGKRLKDLSFENNHKDASLCLKHERKKSQIWLHDTVSGKHKTHGENGQREPVTCQLKDDDLLISAVIKNKNLRAKKKQYTFKRNSCKSRYLRSCRSQKGSCRLLPRNLNKGCKQFMEGKWFNFGLRTVLSWLIHRGFVFLNEVIQYRNPYDNAVVKDGLVTCDGILCRCCGELYSFSEFKTHAGFSLNRPCLNLFLESGKSFTLCQLEAWSAEYKARKTATQTAQVGEVDHNDDSCGLCGDGGVLLCCENCPSTFHQACLYTQEIPEGDWYCPNCTCWMCGLLAGDNEALGSPSAFKCSQCEHKYHQACVQEKDRSRVAASGTRFCGEGCEQVHAGLQSRIGVMNMLSDGFSWTLLRCIHNDQKVHSAQKFVALKAECNSKLAVALTIMEECFLPMVDPRTGIDMIPHVVYNWGSKFPRLNFDGFYTIVLEKNDVVVSVASVRIHGVAVAEMPLIATCNKHRRQGMCRRLMNSIEEMLASFKVEMLVICAIPDLVETWTFGFGFKPLEDHEKKSLSTINLMVFPGTIWLKKHLRENFPADQHLGVGGVDVADASPSEAVDPIESGALPGGGLIVQPDQDLDKTLFIREADIDMGITHADSGNLLVGGELDGHLCQRFSELLSKEDASKLQINQEASKSEGNLLEIVSNVKYHKICDDIPCLTAP